jgi:hypothetical protein
MTTNVREIIKIVNNRVQTIQNSQILAQDRNHRYQTAKQQILNYSRDLYVAMTKNVIALQPESLWTVVKTELNIGDRPLFKATPMPTMIQHREYYDYTQDGMYVVFANKHLGGGFRGSGWVQEEIITVEFYEMAMGIDMLERSGQRQLSQTQAALWFSLLRNSVANQNKYGGSNIRRDVDAHTFRADQYLSPPTDYKFVDLISIDAPQRENRDALYTFDEIRFLFLKALAGFETAAAYGCKKIHSGGWGAGVFNNQVSVILSIQVLAAWLAGIEEFHYWGAKDAMKDPIFLQTWQFLQENRIATVSDMYSDLAVQLRLPPNLQEIIRPIIEVPIFEQTLWYWKNDNNNWIAYDAQIQEQLRNKQDDAIITIDGKQYQIIKEGEFWKQIRLDNPRLRRHVKPAQ